MSDNSKYVNYGNVGAMGDHATASNFTFGSEVKEAQQLTIEDVSILNKLVESLNNYNGEGIKKSEIMNASTIIQELAENVEDENVEEQNKSISKWKLFIGEATQPLMDVIKVVSASLGVAENIKSLLGI